MPATAAPSTPFDMPRLTDSMEEGTVLRWLKAVGDTVAVGDELVEIETDKANMTCESYVAGTLLEILVEEGQTRPIGATIARIGEPGAQPAEADAPSSGDGAGAAATSAPAAAPTPVPPAGAATPAGEATSNGARVKASPVARRLAAEHGLDLTTVVGSGPGGRIVKSDVETALAATPPGGAAEAPAAPAPRVADDAPAAAGKGAVETIAPTRLQQTVARRMAESKATVPHFHLTTEIDMTRCVEARARMKATAREGEPVASVNDMVVKAVALALRDFPRANGAYKDGAFELYARINVGVAVAAQDALVVPTLFDADRKGLVEIARETRRLAERVRDGSITPPELANGTFTVSNLGMYGVTEFAAVINPPQAGILAVGAIVERPVVRDGELATAHTLRATLACDHRILYGADGAQLLARIRALLEEPVSLAC